MVRLNRVVNGMLICGVTMLAAIQSATAATQVTGVRLNPTEEGLELVLQTTGVASQQSRAQVFTVSRGNLWTADITSTSLDLGGDNRFWQNNPAPGIASVAVRQLDNNSIRVTVAGVSRAPEGQVIREGQQGQQNIAFGIRARAEDQGAVSNATSPGSENQLAQTPTGQSLGSQTTTSQTPPQTPASVSTPAVMVPNPEITIEGSPGINPSEPVVPSLQPRAIAPPVGDIAVSTTDSVSSTINLGTTERIPRLVLREAPIRDVLALLARAAGLNLAFADPSAFEGGGNPNNSAPPANSSGETAEPLTISLDIENEPVQDVFNYVLQLAGLEANRRGRTIFVGSRLPNAARNVIIRSLRMNQVTAGVALNFLVAMGAESAVSRERQVVSVAPVAVQLPENIGQNAIAPIPLQTQTTTEERVETQRVNYEDSTPILRGMQVLGDERTNTLTLIGSPRQVEIATAQLVQLDVRRRQVAVNVRVVDVNLSAIEDFSGSFSFGIGDTTVQGIAAANLDGGASISLDPGFANAFTAKLEAQVTSGNAKILTDPTLIVQEGQTATVALTEEVQTTTGTTTTSSDGTVISFEQDDPRAAGLTLAIAVNRIDDNGFVSLSVAPTITAPSSTQENPDGSETTLLSSRSLQSGQIRLRDGQTLILSGIIQDSDRTTVSKVPILGDIPLLGALFRSTDRQNSRREVIVLLTPQVINDSDLSTFGYSYTPGREAQQLMQR